MHVWMHPSGPASGTNCKRAFSSICIPAVLHTGETDRNVICNISVFLISSMNYPPSLHDFISFLGRLCCTCYFLFYRDSKRFCAKFMLSELSLKFVELFNLAVWSCCCSQ